MWLRPDSRCSPEPRRVDFGGRRYFDTAERLTLRRVLPTSHSANPQQHLPAALDNSRPRVPADRLAHFRSVLADPDIRATLSPTLANAADFYVNNSNMHDAHVRPHRRRQGGGVAGEQEAEAEEGGGGCDRVESPPISAELTKWFAHHDLTGVAREGLLV